MYAHAHRPVRASIPVESLPREVELAAEIREGGVSCTYAALVAQAVGGRVAGPGHRGADDVDGLLRPRDAEQVARVPRSAAETMARILDVPVGRRLGSGVGAGERRGVLRGRGPALVGGYFSALAAASPT